MPSHEKETGPIPPRQERVPIVSNEKTGENAFVIRLKSDHFVNQAVPGQFFHVRVTNTLDPLLRRPISLHRLRPDSGCVDLLYKCKGAGTRLLAKKKAGETLDVIGPLGRGFPQAKGRTYLVAGGMGVAPFPALIDSLLTSCTDKPVVLLGSQTASALLCVDEMRSMGVEVQIATDDGSAGYHGNASDLTRSLDPPDTIFCCGPNPMLRALVLYALDKDIDCWVSTEERMACGIGMCRACAIRLTEGKHQRYRRVCFDGPVFSARQLSGWAKQNKQE